MSSSAPAAPGSAKSPLAILFLTVFIDLLGFGLVIPTLPIYARTFHASDTQVTMLAASYSLAQLVFAPIWGRISDRIGRRPVLAMTACGAVIAYCIFGLAGSLWLLYASRIFAGICGGNLSTAQAYIADVTTPATRHRGMAIIGAAFGLGFTVGPAVGGLAAHYLGTRSPYFIAAGLASANALWILWRLPEPARHTARPRRGFSSYADALTLRPFAYYLLVFFLVTYAFSHIEQAFVLFTTDTLKFTERDNGLSFMLIGLVLTIMQGLVVRKLRWGPLPMIVAGAFIAAIGAGIIPLASVWWHILPACVLTAVGNSFYQPSLATALSLAAPTDRQGEMLGVSQSASALARVVGAASAGLLYEHLTHAAPFVMAATVLALAALLILPRVRRPVAA
jgi:DHA1 family tetracycline resistance protein-like MFS transporter